MKFRAILIFAGLLAMLSTAAQAAWPEKTITFIVPVPSGGLNDNSARITAQWLAKSLKVNVVVENKLGGNTAIGADYVARSRPDGYTFLMAAPPALVMVPHVQKVPYDTFTSFIPISQMDASYMAFAVNPTVVPVNTLAELVTYAKTRPSQLTYATGAVGGTGHLSMELLLKQAGVKMTHVAYKGNSEALVATLGGHVQVYAGTMSDVVSHHKSGKLRILGVSSTQRMSKVSDVPTVAEQGFAGYKIVTWNGLFAPVGTPKAIIGTIADSLKRACQDATFVASYQAIGVDAVCSTPEQFAERLRADWTLWGDAVKGLGSGQK